MKLTNKQIRRVIVEKPDQVLSENVAFFGEAFTQFKNKVDAGETAALQIPATELTAKNLGISTFGKPYVVILNASLWKDGQ